MQYLYAALFSHLFIYGMLKSSTQSQQRKFSTAFAVAGYLLIYAYKAVNI